MPPSWPSRRRSRARTSRRARRPTLQEFGAALARDDVPGGYALTSADFQKRTPYDAFAARLGANPADTKAYGKRVGDGAARVAPRVDLQLPQGETLALVLEDRPLARRRARCPIPGASGHRARRCARSCARWASAATTSCCGWCPRRHRVDLTADKLRQYWEAHQDETRGAADDASGRAGRPDRRVRRRGPHALWSGVRITGQLIEAATGIHLWAERYDRDLTDIFAVQDEITQSVAAAIEPAMAQAERQRVSRKPPDSLDAWEAYHRGLWHFLNQEPSENEQAKRFFQRAIDLDAGFAGGYYALALCNVWDGWVYASRPMKDCVNTARPLAQRALALDDANSMCHCVMGFVLFMGGDTPGGRSEYERAISLNPNHAWAVGALGGPLRQ